MSYMEWSKDKTLKLIELLQVNPCLWNPSLCDTRRDKQKRKEELRAISNILSICVSDTTKKIQHLRTQYNREAGKEARANAEDPNDRYVSNWYAFEYLHFMKDSSKPYRLLQSVTSEEGAEVNSSGQNHPDNSLADCKIDRVSVSPPLKVPRLEDLQPLKSDVAYPPPRNTYRDEFSVFGEYIANELRSLKGEKNLLVAKKKIQDVIFEVKMGVITDPSAVPTSSYGIYNNTRQNSTPPSNGKIYATSTLEQMTTPQAASTPPTSGMSEIIINSACHYSNFKVDNQ